MADERSSATWVRSVAIKVSPSRFEGTDGRDGLVRGKGVGLSGGMACFELSGEESCVACCTLAVSSARTEGVNPSVTSVSAQSRKAGRPVLA